MSAKARPLLSVLAKRKFCAPSCRWASEQNRVKTVRKNPGWMEKNCAV
jgi:hypothetical protein